MRITLLSEEKQPFWLTPLLLLLCLGAGAQTAKPVSITATPQRVNLFLHLDKTIYQPNESVWFTGYVLNRDADLMRAQNTLYVVLVDPVGKSVLCKGRFLMQSGLGKGSLVLPDSIAAGDYWFLGYTNALLETGDQPVFRQLISVRTGEPSPFRITSTKLEEHSDSLFVRYRISTANSGLAAGGKFTYTLFDSSQAIGSGQRIIDPFGEVVLYLGPKQDVARYQEMAVTISRGELTKKFFFPIHASESFALQTGVFDPQVGASKEGMNPKGEVPTVNVQITPDSNYYHRRSRVTLHIRLRNQTGKPVPGIFSLSVVASRRLGSVQPRGIADYDRSPASDPAAISELRSFAGEMPDYGYVLEDNDKVSKPVDLALMGSQFASFKTDAKGQFGLPYNALVVPEGETNCLSVTAKSPDRYKIMVYSRADTFDAQLATFHYPIMTPGFEIASDPEDLVQQASRSVLKAAVVKATIKSEMDYGSGYYNSTHCEDDYVCTHNHGGPGWGDILNCPFMVANGPCEKIKPKEGGFYHWVLPELVHDRHPGAIAIIYHCKTPPVPHFMKVLEPIHRERPFVVPYSSQGELFGSGLQSTVYWNHGLTTDGNGEMIVSFFTDDLTGSFTCSLQGVSSAGVITGNAGYNVVQPNPIAASGPNERANTSTDNH